MYSDRYAAMGAGDGSYPCRVSDAVVGGGSTSATRGRVDAARGPVGGACARMAGMGLAHDALLSFLFLELVEYSR